MISIIRIDRESIRNSKGMETGPREIQSKKRKAKGERRKLNNTISERIKEMRIVPGPRMAATRFGMPR